MKGYFVTGTDTNVGKTVASAYLMLALDGDYW
ncbi:MAG TPA: AAA family ATPase, partial [Alphaproteobacteria bacterium]|nr:AAA family ATPase [Alphaproteobacteria bacterium]